MTQHRIPTTRDDGWSRGEPAFCGVCSVCGHMVACDEFGLSDENCPQSEVPAEVSDEAPAPKMGLNVR